MHASGRAEISQGAPGGGRLHAPLRRQRPREPECGWQLPNHPRFLQVQPFRRAPFANFQGLSGTVLPIDQFFQHRPECTIPLCPLWVKSGH